MPFEPRRGVIYVVVDKLQTPRYVGKTVTSCEQRFKRHVRGVHRNDRSTKHLPFHRWLAKHLDEAEVIEIETGIWSKAELGRREVMWIAYFGIETLLNVASGGNGGSGRGGTREQALRAWETRRASGTNTWKWTQEQRDSVKGRAPRGGWNSAWRLQHPEWERTRVASVVEANKKRDHHWAGQIEIECKCGCGTALLRAPGSLHRRFVDRSHYLAYVRRNAPVEII
jgi:hypothetical protein